MGFVISIYLTIPVKALRWPTVCAHEEADFNQRGTCTSDVSDLHGDNSPCFCADHKHTRFHFH